MSGDDLKGLEPTHPATLEDLAARFRELPVMPRTVAEVLAQLAGPDWTIAEVERTIAADPALVARMIGVSNSALYGGGQEFKTLNQALVRLGYRAIRSLAIVAAARALFPLDDEQLANRAQELWRHSAACGWAARMVAEAVEQPDPDDAFAAGALHDIGKVVILLNSPDDDARIRDLVAAGTHHSRAAELEVVGIDHAELAAWLTAGWHLPATVVESVIGHHDPDAAGEHDRLARIVACGDTLSHLHAGGPPELRRELYASLAVLGLASDQAEALAVNVLEELTGMADLV